MTEAMRWMVAAAGLAAALTGRAAEAMTPLRLAAMSRAEAATGLDVALEGVVTFVSALETNRFAVASRESPRRMGVFVLAAEGVEMPEPGDVVLVRGRTTVRRRHPALVATHIDEVRQTDLPEPPGVKQSDFRQNKLYGRRIALAGTVRDLRTDEAENGAEMTRMMLYIDNYSACVLLPGAPDPSRYLGRRVRVTGAADGRYGAKGDFLEAELELESEEDIRFLDEGLSTSLFVAAGALGVVLVALVCVLLALWLREARELRESAVIAAERRRMAADLHDTIEQHLAGANLLAAGVLALEDVPEDVAEAMRTLSGLLANAKAEVRDAVMNLRGEAAGRRTPAEALAEVARGLSRTGVATRRMLRGLPEHLPEGMHQDLLLIVREATTNAVKHGHARHVVLVSDPLGAEGGFTLRILNDGEPFDAARALGPETGHFGLSGMRERALRNGFDIAWTREGRWTAVVVTFRGRGRKAV